MAHLDNAQLAAVMTQREGPRLDVRGTRLASEDLKRVMKAAWRGNTDLNLRKVLLDWATVEDNVVLGRGDVDDVSLRSATIGGDVSLHAWVTGSMSFDGVRVGGDVLVSELNINGSMSFDEATVCGKVSLKQATIGTDVSVRRATVTETWTSGG